MAATGLDHLPSVTPRRDRRSDVATHPEQEQIAPLIVGVVCLRAKSARNSVWSSRSQSTMSNTAMLAPFRCSKGSNATQASLPDMGIRDCRRECRRA
jgi:type IV pilus biogenesis protein CpaD/CtpE